WVGTELARRFGLPVWQFSLTATDANRWALRLARWLTGRAKGLVFYGCYHRTVDEAVMRLDPGRRPTPRASQLGACIGPPPTPPPSPPTLSSHTPSSPPTPPAPPPPPPPCPPSRSPPTPPASPPPPPDIPTPCPSPPPTPEPASSSTKRRRSRPAPEATPAATV